MQGLTSIVPEERAALINMLEATAGTGFMHESFDPNDPGQFTRPWFAWANSLFGEIVGAWLAKAGPERGQVIANGQTVAQ